MTLHDFVEGAVGLAVTAVFALGLGLLVHDAYVYLYTGAVDWFTGDQVMDQLAGQVCTAGVKWVALCDMLTRIHVGFLLVIVGPLLITLLGAVPLLSAFSWADSSSSPGTSPRLQDAGSH